MIINMLSGAGLVLLMYIHSMHCRIVNKVLVLMSIIVLNLNMDTNNNCTTSIIYTT